MLLPLAARELEKTQKIAQQQKRLQDAGASSRSGSPLSTPKKTTKKLGVGSPKYSGASTPVRGDPNDQRMLDFSALNLHVDDGGEQASEEVPKIKFAREKLLEEVSKKLKAIGENEKKGVSLVVIGEPPLSI